MKTMKIFLRDKLIQEGIMDNLQLYIQNKYNNLKDFIELDKLKEKLIEPNDTKDNTKDIKDQGNTDASLPNVG